MQNKITFSATASGQHVLAATSYSKSTLRSVAGALAAKQARIDYFPSFEIVTNPRLCSASFDDNLRSVRPEAVETVMNHFFAQHPVISKKNKQPDTTHSSKDDVLCEEAILEAFGK